MSSRRRERRHACGRKTTYPTAAAATANAARLRRCGERVHIYRCEFCRLFHIGHIPYRVRQAIAARRGRTA